MLQQIDEQNMYTAKQESSSAGIVKACQNKNGHKEYSDNTITISIEKSNLPPTFLVPMVTNRKCSNAVFHFGDTSRFHALDMEHVPEIDTTCIYA